jgi:hypothetical protein
MGETWARSTVESNICTRCADELNEARWSKNVSKTAALLNRSNRFHTLFHLPKRFGSARQVMMQRFQKQQIVTALGAASRQRRAEHRNRRQPIQFRHCRGHAALRISRQSMNHIEPSVELSIMYLSQFVQTA